jgi:hypothetical protein
MSTYSQEGQVHLFVKHSVKDFDAWLAVFKGASAVHDKYKSLSQDVYRSADNANEVTVHHTFASMEDGQAIMAAPELKVAMESGGVEGSPTVWFANQV